MGTKPITLPWHQKDPQCLRDLQAAVQAQYPNLHFYPQVDRVVVKGTFPLEHEGVVIDRYHIEIDLLEDFPQSVPVVREVGGRIPRQIDCHVNQDGTTCPYVRDEQWSVFPSGSTLLDFLNGPIRNYFLGQCLVEQGQPWPFGEWAHKEDGRREYYEQLFQTHNRAVIYRYLTCLEKKKIKSHWPCPCGSGSRIRNCHRSFLKNLHGKLQRAIVQEAICLFRG